MNTRFLKVSSSQPVIDYLTHNINRHLAKDQKVLWLLPGGSGIPIAVAIAKNLAKTDTRNLTIILTDERYGRTDHADSNWFQLKRAGFALPTAQLQPVLDGSSLGRTTDRYNRLLNGDIIRSDYKIGLLGMGADGHIAGIKPGSPAVKTDQMAASYNWSDYTRLTITPAALARLDGVVLYAVGEEKHDQLEKLDRDLSIDEQPVQLLKQLKKSVIFNDYKGDEV